MDLFRRNAVFCAGDVTDGWAPAPAELASAAVAMATCPHPAGVLYRTSERMLVRYRSSHGGASVMMKMWARPGWRGVLRRLTGSSNCQREYAALVTVHRAGVRVPRPIGWCRLWNDPGGFTEALFMEDLGRCSSSTEYLKEIIRQGREDLVREFDENVIHMTKVILAAGILDPDHGLVNIVLTADGHLARLDMELARKVLGPMRTVRYRLWGEMIGRLIATYTFAVQPDSGRAVRFAHALDEHLSLSASVRRAAARFVHRMMRHQRKTTGIDTTVALEWD